jgi:hypothetical protein
LSGFTAPALQLKILQGAKLQYFSFSQEKSRIRLMRKSLVACVVSLVAVVLLFVTTDPNKVPSFTLPIPFLLLFASSLLFFSWLLQKYAGMTVRRSLRVGVLCVGIPMILLVLQSIGQLTVKDVLTLAVLFLVSYFYMTRSTAPS